MGGYLSGRLHCTKIPGSWISQNHIFSPNLQNQFFSPNLQHLRCATYDTPDVIDHVHVRHGTICSEREPYEKKGMGCRYLHQKIAPETTCLWWTKSRGSSGWLAVYKRLEKTARKVSHTFYVGHAYVVHGQWWMRFRWSYHECHRRACPYRCTAEHAPIVVSTSAKKTISFKALRRTKTIIYDRRKLFNRQPRCTMLRGLVFNRTKQTRFASSRCINYPAKQRHLRGPS